MITLLCLCSIVGQVPHAEHVQRQAVNPRQAIVSGEIEYDFSWGYFDEKTEKNVWRAISWRDRLVFDTQDGFHAFMERWEPLRTNVSEDGLSLLLPYPRAGRYERFIVRPDRTFQCFPGAEKIVVREVDFDPMSHVRAIVKHPWHFGLTSETMIAAELPPWDDVINPAEFRDRVIDKDELDDEFCYLIRYRNRHNDLVNVWYDPAKGMNARKFTLEGNVRGSKTEQKFEISVTSELRKDRKADVWFPAEVVYWSARKDRPDVRGMERIRVHQAKLNIPIDPAQFDLDAMLTPLSNTDD